MDESLCTCTYNVCTACICTCTCVHVEIYKQLCLPKHVFFLLVKSRGLNKEGGKKDHWQPLPEWVSEENGESNNSVGVFDKKGRFSLTDKVLVTIYNTNL